MQYGKFFVILFCCKRDFPCILHVACFLFINIKNYWNRPRKPVAQPASLDDALKLVLTYKSFKGSKNSICNVFDVISELIAYLQRIHVLHIFFVRNDKSVYKLI